MRAGARLTATWFIRNKAFTLERYPFWIQGSLGSLLEGESPKEGVRIPQCGAKEVEWSSVPFDDLLGCKPCAGDLVGGRFRGEQAHACVTSRLDG